MLTYPDRVQLAQLPTPLQPLDRLSEKLAGPRIWLKRDDLSGSHLSGNKVRKLEFILARTQAQGADILITCGGTQSNHCRATALVAAQLGLKCHLILRQDPLPAGSTELHDGNLLLDELAGAKIDVYPAKGFGAGLRMRMQAVADRYSTAGVRPYLIPVGASDGIGIWGYIAAAEELKNDFKRAAINSAVIACASGSGGTQAGLIVGVEGFKIPAEVLGFAVCDNAAYFHAKIKSDIAHWRREWPEQAAEFGFDADVSVGVDTNVDIKVNVNDVYIGDGYALASDEVLQTIAMLAREEGVLLDPVYTGKAFFGLLEEIKKDTFDGVSDVVFIHTGGLFGLFPWRQRLNRLVF